MAGQRPLLERAAAGDREAFALLYDDQVDAVYRYLLAWTGNPAEAASLTRQVFHTALAWLPSTTRKEVEAGAWLIAMARDAVAQRGGAARVAGAAGVGGVAGVAGAAGVAGSAGTPGAAAGAVAAVARLGDPEREVVVLRLLLGHSLAHTAHLSGYSQRAVIELQLAACLSIQKLTGGTHAAPPAPEAQTASAEEFERRLGPWDVDPTGSDPALAAALAVARSLRQATPRSMASPDPELVDQLRHEVVTGRAGTETVGTNPGVTGTVTAGTVGAGAAVDSPQHLPLGSATFPLRGPQQPEDADAAARVLFEGPQPEVPTSAAPVLFEGPVEEDADAAAPGLFERARPEAAESAFSRLFKRPWVATAVATAGIVVVLALQAFGKPAPPGTCDGRPCPASTTAAVAAAVDNSVGTPLSTVLQPTTTSTTLAGQAPAPTAAPTSAATAPPATRPATTAPPTTAPRSTTTRAPTTTAPPTTAATTTTTAATATT
jgi:DNA-directed RNA polymerase specialized sigma24 family protein